MKSITSVIIALAASTAAAPPTSAQAVIHPAAVSLMHESRETVLPRDGSTAGKRFVSFQWPLPAGYRTLGAPLDGFEKEQEKPDKSKLRYKIRFSTDPEMKTGVKTVATLWPFYNALEITTPDTWYWQYATSTADGQDNWSPVYSFKYSPETDRFAPPSFGEFIAKLPASHPRILTDRDNWDTLIASSLDKPERLWYIEAADKALKTPVKDIKNIPTGQLANLSNQMQRNSWLTRESRRIIDAEEKNVEVLTRAYVLTRNRKYADAAMRRVATMKAWSNDPHVKGDFNDATLLSLCTLAYDTFYDLLDNATRASLLSFIDEKAAHMYDHFNNYLENHIAENHIWQMTLCIATNAALATYGDLDHAALWAEYCYNVWLARFPGLNDDGGWHNGDSYYTVNTRTLVELPLLMRRISGFDYFSDPWYDNNVMYAIYQQPPFSKSGGNGSSHLKVWRPNSIRVSQLDALARIKGNTYAADYVRRTLARDPFTLKKALAAKAGDLAWVRIQLDEKLPDGDGLASLPAGHVFPQTGLASFVTDFADTEHSAMWSFRSSPYGSTSHALANQNAFNTFYGGDPLFYSSGHHIEFTDVHSMLCHRSTRGHNTILVDGMGQQIGVEGYGWIPRHYVGKQIGYVVGDASNAYGKVVSPLWLERGRLSDVEYTPENGWDENHLKTYRRHIVNLGNSGLMLVYDELEADRPVEWSYMLHTVLRPMDMEHTGNAVHVTARNDRGASDAYIYASGKLAADTTSKFFRPAVNWLQADENGNFKPYADHWHFTARSSKSKTYRFVTLIDTHDKENPACVPVSTGAGKFRFGEWIVSANIKTSSRPGFTATDGNGCTITYDGNVTRIMEDGQETILADTMPELEI